MRLSYYGSSVGNKLTLTITSLDESLSIKWPITRKEAREFAKWLEDWANTK